MTELDEHGMPQTASELKDLVDILPPEELERRANIGIELSKTENVN